MNETSLWTKEHCLDRPLNSQNQQTEKVWKSVTRIYHSKRKQKYDEYKERLLLAVTFGGGGGGGSLAHRIQWALEEMFRSIGVHSELPGSIKKNIQRRNNEIVLPTERLQWAFRLFTLNISASLFTHDY